MKKIALLLSLIMIIALSGCSSAPKYYTNSDFLSDDTETIVYETGSKNVNWGTYQVNKEELTGNCVELYAESVVVVEESEFTAVVKSFKEKIDALELPYAAGYTGERANEINIKIDADKIGLPVLALWNISSSYDKSVVSELGDFKATGIDSLTYELGADKKYVITVGIPEAKQEDFVKYCAANVGKSMYLKLGSMTFSSAEITDNMEKDSIDFKGFSFVGKNADDSKYESVMKLAEYVVNKVPGETRNETSFGLSVEGETKYGIPYVTELDQEIMELVNAKYPDVEFRRKGVENRISFNFANSHNEDLTTEEYFNRVEDIYTMCNFDEGAYSDISFSWSSSEKEGYGDSVAFYKTNGKMVCGYVSERIEEKANRHAFFIDHMNNN